MLSNNFLFHYQMTPQPGGILMEWLQNKLYLCLNRLTKAQKTAFVSALTSGFFPMDLHYLTITSIMTALL